MFDNSFLIANTVKDICIQHYRKNVNQSTEVEYSWWKLTGIKQKEIQYPEQRKILKRNSSINRKNAAQ